MTNGRSHATFCLLKAVCGAGGGVKQSSSRRRRVEGWGVKGEGRVGEEPAASTAYRKCTQHDIEKLNEQRS